MHVCVSGQQINWSFKKFDCPQILQLSAKWNKRHSTKTHTVLYMKSRIFCSNGCDPGPRQPNQDTPHQRQAVTARNPAMRIFAWLWVKLDLGPWLPMSFPLRGLSSPCANLDIAWHKMTFWVFMVLLVKEVKEEVLARTVKAFHQLDGQDHPKVPNCLMLCWFTEDVLR